MLPERRTLPPDDARRRFEIGVRVALEEMLTGRDYARVENILRALVEDRSGATDSDASRRGTIGRPQA